MWLHRDEHFLKKEKYSMLKNPYITENDEDSFRTGSLSDQQQNYSSQNIEPVSPAQPATALRNTKF